MTQPLGRLASNIEQQHHFIFEVGKVLPTLVNASVTRIMGVPRDGGAFEHRGTALLCEIGGQQAVVTANHVLTEMDKERRFASASLSCASKSWHSTNLAFPDIDVAVFLPDVPIELSEEKKFWPSSICDDSSDILADDYVLLQGFPVRFARFTVFGPAYLAESYTHCTSIRPRESDFPEEVRAHLKVLVPDYPLIPEGILRSSQFALNYAEDTGPLKTAEGEEVTNKNILEDYRPLYYDSPTFPGQKPWGPFGLSGSPVWRFGAYECGWNFDKWSPSMARLAGIVTHWNEAHQILVVTEFAEVLRHLRDAK
jgi:hypothetical protein